MTFGGRILGYSFLLQFYVTMHTRKKTMECARITEAFQPLEVTSLPLPECPDEGLLLKTLYAGVCHSDLRVVDDEMDLGQGKIFRHRDVLGKYVCN